MELKYLNPKSLKMNKNKVRKNSKTVSVVIDSIEDFGFINPILINSDYEVICGEVRLIASLKLKLEKIPCIIVNELTEEQQKAYRIIDNQLQELSLWNYDNKKAELDKIKMNLVNYGLPEEYYEHIDIDEFFQKDKHNQICLFEEAQ